VRHHQIPRLTGHFQCIRLDVEGGAILGGQ